MGNGHWRTPLRRVSQDRHNRIVRHTVICKIVKAMCTNTVRAGMPLHRQKHYLVDKKKTGMTKEITTKETKWKPMAKRNALLAPYMDVLQ